MIYALTNDVAADMNATTKVADVRFGHDRFAREVPTRPLVVVLYDELADQYDPPGTSRSVTNATTWKKWVGVVVEIQGVSNKAGAGEWDHKRAVEGLVDLFLLSLLRVAHTRANDLRNVTGGFLAPKATGTEREPAREHGARYELRFQVGRSVLDKTAKVAASPLVGATLITVNGQTVSGVPGSSLETMTPKVTMTGSPNITVSASSTYTRDAGSFLADGFLVGMTVAVAGCTTSTNNGNKTITAINALTIQVAEACATDALVAGVTIKS